MENPEKQDTISKSHLSAGRAIDQLRRQLGIVFEEDNGTRLGAIPVEGLTVELLAGLSSKKYVLLTAARARKIGFDVDASAKTVRVNAEQLSLQDIQALADPLVDQPLPKITLMPTSASHDMLLAMVKYAGLLPAMVIIENSTFPAEWLSVKAGCVAVYWNHPSVDMVPLAEAKLPIEGAENAKLICFRQRYGTSMHLAFIIGEPGDAPLTRIHSSCVTGDILGSLRCDCGDQLKLALNQITEAGQGILLYLHQEGRGIGIANKLRAYMLQERGIDTYDANLMLGFDEDERDFSIAAAILKKLGVSKIKMLTNNPQKMAAMEKNGIGIKERVPLIIPAGKHNHAYLDAKAKKTGHLF